MADVRAKLTARRLECEEALAALSGQVPPAPSSQHRAQKASHRQAPSHCPNPCPLPKPRPLPKTLPHCANTLPTGQHPSQCQPPCPLPTPFPTAPTPFPLPTPCHRRLPRPNHALALDLDEAAEGARHSRSRLAPHHRPPNRATPTHAHRPSRSPPTALTKLATLRARTTGQPQRA
eukprot:1785342-Prymnesium_polylepis.1